MFSNRLILSNRVTINNSLISSIYSNSYYKTNKAIISSIYFNSCYKINSKITNNKVSNRVSNKANNKFNNRGWICLVVYYRICSSNSKILILIIIIILIIINNRTLWWTFFRTWTYSKVHFIIESRSRRVEQLATRRTVQESTRTTRKYGIYEQTSEHPNVVTIIRKCKHCYWKTITDDGRWEMMIE